MYSYIGENTVLYGGVVKSINDIKEGDEVLSLYIGPGLKQPKLTKVKSIKNVGKHSCYSIGGLQTLSYIKKDQCTINDKFEIIEIKDVIYSMNRSIPQPIAINDTINCNVYELILDDDSCVPLIGGMLFIAYTNKKYKPVNKQTIKSKRNIKSKTKNNK